MVGTGTSNSSYDWIFKVRDKYESYIDTGNLQPLKFIRNVDEGGYKINENITFNQQTNTAVSEKVRTTTRLAYSLSKTTKRHSFLEALERSMENLPLSF